MIICINFLIIIKIDITKNNKTFSSFNGFATVTPKTGTPKLKRVQIYIK